MDALSRTVQAKKRKKGENKYADSMVSGAYGKDKTSDRRKLKID